MKMKNKNKIKMNIQIENENFKILKFLIFKKNFLKLKF